MAARRKSQILASSPAWTPSTFQRLIERARHDDRAAVETLIALIEDDESRPWGMLLKSEAARILRQSAHLDAGQIHRLRTRFTDMLLRGYLPREYKQYAKLFRKIGLGDFRHTIETRADQSNSFVRRWCWYLLVDHEGPRPSRYRRPW
jgi:hypothetical protein